MSKIEGKHYITDEHGNIIDVLDSGTSYVKLEDGDRVLRKGLIEYLRDTVDVKYRFVKINPKVWGYVGTKYPILNILVNYMEYYTNELRFKNGRLIKRKHLAELCKVSESTISRQLQGLMSEDIIHHTRIHGELAYIVNPWVCVKSKRICLALYEEFKLTSWRGKVEDMK